MNLRLPALTLLALVSLSACQRTTDSNATKNADGGNTSTDVAVTHQPSPALVQAARDQIGVTVRYDPTYFTLSYPGGDVPPDRGVCTDVVIRALRNRDIDLQARIHEDMRGHFKDYPASWGLSRPDSNIDHRRVPNQMRWFERQGWQQPISQHAADYAAGDIVAWKLNGNGLLHVGIVSDRHLADGTPLILHNIARGTQEENLLFRHTIIGHYRLPG